MHIRFYLLLMFVFIGISNNNIDAQSNKKANLLHFTMPDNIPANGTFKIQGYVKNTGNGTIPHGLRVKYMVKAPTNVGTAEEGWHYTESQSEELPLLHEGDSIYVERTFQATPEVFTQGRSNIVIIWPTINLLEDRDAEIGKNIFVYNGTGGSTNTYKTAEDEPHTKNMEFPEEGITKLRIMIPNSKNQDAASMECYDAFGNLVAQQSIRDKMDNSHLFSIAGLVKGQHYTIVIKDEQGNVLQRTPIRKR